MTQLQNYVISIKHFQVSVHTPSRIRFSIPSSAYLGSFWSHWRKYLLHQKVIDYIPKNVTCYNESSHGVIQFFREKKSWIFHHDKETFFAQLRLHLAQLIAFLICTKNVSLSAIRNCQEELLLHESMIVKMIFLGRLDLLKGKQWQIHWNSLQCTHWISYVTAQ